MRVQYCRLPTLALPNQQVGVPIAVPSAESALLALLVYFLMVEVALVLVLVLVLVLDCLKYMLLADHYSL